MNKLPEKQDPAPEIRHNEKPSRLPLNRLAEAKLLNSQLGHHLRKSLFPKAKAN